MYRYSLNDVKVGKQIFFLVFLCPPSLLLSVYLLFSFQEQRRSDSSTDIDMSKKNFLEKSLPTAFNVSKRLKASKKKEESLSNGAKTYQGIREKVFSTRHCYPLVEVSVHS